MSKRFQYKVETVKTSLWSSKAEKADGVIQDRLTRLGSEGWELVAVQPFGHYNRVFLKRET